jgi:hypothetical protein
VTAPAPSKSVSAQDILKSMLDVFKDAYTFLKKMDTSEIFMAKVLVHSAVTLSVLDIEIECGVVSTAIYLMAIIIPHSCSAGQ